MCLPRRGSAVTIATPAHEKTEEVRHLRLIKGGGSGARQLSLPYEYEVAPGVPAVPPESPHLRLIGSSEQEANPTLPPAGAWTAKMARAITEVALGERPPQQLAAHLSREQLQLLTLRGRAAARHPSRRGQDSSSRVRTVRAVRVCPVAPGIVETSAVLVGGPRVQAIAMRLEAVDDRWVATAVEMR